MIFVATPGTIARDPSWWPLLVLVACGNSGSSSVPEPLKTDPPKTNPRLAFDLPQASAGYEPLTHAPLTLIAGDTAIVIDGSLQHQAPDRRRGLRGGPSAGLE
jgi:hypothetical protein